MSTDRRMVEEFIGKDDEYVSTLEKLKESLLAALHWLYIWQKEVGQTY